MGISIRELLDELPRIQEKDVGDWCNRLCAFYEKNDRHSYSEITEYILTTDGGIEYAQRIVEVLSVFLQNFEDEMVKRKIGKLIDHICLEIVRYRYLSKIIEESTWERFIDFSNENAMEIGKLQEIMERQHLEMEEKRDEMKKYMQAVQDEVTESRVKMKEVVVNMNTVQKRADKTAKK